MSGLSYQCDTKSHASHFHIQGQGWIRVWAWQAHRDTTEPRRMKNPIHTHTSCQNHAEVII